MSCVIVSHFFGLPQPLCVPPTTSLSYLLIEVSAHFLIGASAHPPLHMPKPSQSLFPHLVLHRGHSHLLPNNLISKLVIPSMSTHLFQHLHLQNMCFLNMRFLDRSTLCLICSYKTFIFSFYD